MLGIEMGVRNLDRWRAGYQARAVPTPRTMPTTLWAMVPPRQHLPRTGLAPATSAPGLRSPLPHLHGDCAHRCHICTGTALIAATSAPGLRQYIEILYRDVICDCLDFARSGNGRRLRAEGDLPEGGGNCREWHGAMVTPANTSTAAFCSLPFARAVPSQMWPGPLSRR